MDLARARDAFLVQLQADGRSPHTSGQYRRHLAALDRWLVATDRSRDLARIDHAVLAQFLVSDAARCRPDGEAKKATTTNTLRTSLRAFFGYAHAAGLVATNPARLIRRARCAPPPPRALSDEEVHRLLAVADVGGTEAARRDAVMVRLLLNTGLRLSSALGLRLDDVDLERGEIRVRTAKNDAPVTLPLSRAAARGLRAWLRGRPPGYLFPGDKGPLTRRQAGRRIDAVAQRAGLGGRATAHALRHTFATQLLRRTGGNLLLVQQALAHRSILSTTIYARLEPLDLRRALA